MKHPIMSGSMLIVRFFVVNFPLRESINFVRWSRLSNQNILDPQQTSRTGQSSDFINVPPFGPNHFDFSSARFTAYSAMPSSSSSIFSLLDQSNHEFCEVTHRLALFKRLKTPRPSVNFLSLKMNFPVEGQKSITPLA